MNSRKQIFYRGVFFINFLFIVFLVGYYGFRLIHYYKLEHKKEQDLVTLTDRLTQDSNVVVTGDGLYEEDDVYHYKGKNVKNYLQYSGYMFRIVKINKDRSIVITTEDTYSSLSYGTVNEYKKSMIRNWLTPIENQPMTGLFYQTLVNPEQYLTATDICIDTIHDIKKITCKKVHGADLVGTMSLYDYEQSGGLSGYLNNGTNYWLSNASKDGAWFVSHKGGLNENKQNERGIGYGVRPVLTLKPTLNSLRGTGTAEDPYVIEQHDVTTLADVYTGKYVQYSGQMFRMIGKSEQGVKLALDGALSVKDKVIAKAISRKKNQYNPKEYNSAGYYLNQTYYKTLTHPEYLTDGTWYTGSYGQTTGYNYASIYSNSVVAKIGMMQVGDLFFQDVPNVLLLNGPSDDEMIYSSTGGTTLYADTITTVKQLRPVLNMIPTVPVVGGDGSKENPYKVGEV